MTVRQFETGATRSPLDGKPQYEGYLNPLVIKRFGEYMLKHQIQANGQTRAADNWQKGIPAASLIDSAWRHFEDWWLHHRGYSELAAEPLEEALCAVIFNASARLKQVVEERLAPPPVKCDTPPLIRVCSLCERPFGSTRLAPNPCCGGPSKLIPT